MATETYVLNTKDMAVTKYTNYEFNGLTAYEGRGYGTLADQLVLLEGDSDLGTSIDASAVTGTTDFESKLLKNIADVYLNTKFVGNLDISLISNETKESIYRLTEVLDDLGLKIRRVKASKGIFATNWQIGIANRDGAYFEVQYVDPTVIVSKRRV